MLLILKELGLENFVKKRKIKNELLKCVNIVNTYSLKWNI